jgi:hypothetical protein
MPGSRLKCAGTSAVPTEGYSVGARSSHLVSPAATKGAILVMTTTSDENEHKRPVEEDRHPRWHIFQELLLPT